MHISSAFSLALALGTALALATPCPATAQSLQAPRAQQAPGYYRFRVGSYVVTALSDGTVAIPWDAILQGMAPDQIRASFSAVGQTPLRDTSINAFLVDTGSKRILIDAGAGALFGDCCGRLPKALADAGYPVDTIDAVLLTHVHGDHSGGLSVNGGRVFPRATIYLARADYDYWMSDAELARAKTSHKAMFAQGRAALAPYIVAGKLHVFHGATTLFPGITTIPAPGHTPGHSFYRIANGQDHVVVIGDIIHAAEVQFPHPEVTADFDADPAQARATRERVLAELARSHELVAADHVSFPGVGHVTRNGKGYQWSAQPYQALVSKAAP
jgi:glyoxylase-like metal-dependent hydrolase (beta-lactamase superfamily II)